MNTETRAKTILHEITTQSAEETIAFGRTLVDLLACAPLGRTNVVVDGHAELASGFLASGNYFSVLGVNARLGRTLVG